MKITANSSFAAYAVNITVNIPDTNLSAEAQKLVQQGVIYEWQRRVNSKAEKALANWPLGRKGRPEKPAGWTRDSIKFTPEGRDALIKLAKEEGFAIEVCEYVPYKPDPSRKSAERFLAMFDGQPELLAAWVKKNAREGESALDAAHRILREKTTKK